MITLFEEFQTSKEAKKRAVSPKDILKGKIEAIIAQTKKEFSYYKGDKLETEDIQQVLLDLAGHSDSRFHEVSGPNGQKRKVFVPNKSDEEN